MNDPKDKPVVARHLEENQGTSEPGITRHGPLLSTDELKEEYLFGVPMRAALTGQEISDETLKRFIRKAVAEVEQTVRIPVTPVKVAGEKIDYERADDIQFGTKKLMRYPVIQVDALQALWPGRNEGQEINYPTNWVELMPETGIIRLVPRSGTDVQADINFIRSVGYQGIPISGLKHWPGMWRISYTAGFPHDKVPDSINDLIGTIAALKLLSQMGPAIFPMSSYSVGIDSMSQSSGNAGPQWLSGRIKELSEERDRMIQQLKAYYGTDITMSVW
jgi:hypothetical protein